MQRVSDMLGKTIDSYQIQKVLGKGGMGVVYKAMDTSLDKVVALKVMNPMLTEDERFLGRFKSEAKALGRLHHPNIVGVFALRHVEQYLFIVMEFVEGVNLADRVKQHGAMVWQDALPIMQQTLRAIDYAHHENIIHRDIKPHNILLSPQGVAKMTDFGLAKIQASRSDSVMATRTGFTGGTLYYMPPEQLEGLLHVDQRGDIYGLGMTYFEMLAGRTPFDKLSSEFAILKAIDAHDFPSLSALNKDVPEPLAQIVMKAVERHPDARYQTAGAMLKDLETWLADTAQAPDSGDRSATTPVGPVSDLASESTKDQGGALKSLKSALSKGLLRKKPSTDIGQTVLTDAPRKASQGQPTASAPPSQPPSPVEKEDSVAAVPPTPEPPPVEEEEAVAPVLPVPEPPAEEEAVEAEISEPISEAPPAPPLSAAPPVEEEEAAGTVPLMPTPLVPESPLFEAEEAEAEVAPPDAAEEEAEAEVAPLVAEEAEAEVAPPAEMEAAEAAAPEPAAKKPTPPPPRTPEPRAERKIWQRPLPIAGGVVLLLALAFLVYQGTRPASMNQGAVDAAEDADSTMAMASLSIQTSPAEAVVFIDSLRVGSTPLTDYEISAGVKTLRIEKDGYVAFDTSIVLDTSQTSTFAFSLLEDTPEEDEEPTVYTLAIGSDPPGAAVFLDGQNVGETPFTMEDPEPGTRALMLRKRGYQDYSGSITVAAGRNTAVQETLTALTAVLQITVRPFGDIYIDEMLKAQQTSDPFSQEVSTGVYQVRVRHPEYGAWERQITIDTSGTQSLLFNYDQEFEVAVTSEPDRADILVDGKPAGKRTPGVVRVRPGRRTIAVQRRGYVMEGAARVITLERNMTAQPLTFSLRAVGEQ